MEISQILEKAKSYLPAEKLDILEEACEFAAVAHEGQRRESGEPYIQHVLETALILANLELDTSSLVAGVLHDVTEKCPVQLPEIEEKFGHEVAILVDGVTKLRHISLHLSDSEKKEVTNAESLRKMLVAMAEDVRVVFIKLADRLHNMRTLGVLPPARQRRIAKETLEIYAPLAHRLGMGEVKSELEDLSFSYLMPRDYTHVSKLATKLKTKQGTVISNAIEALEQELQKTGIKSEVTGRPKSQYSIWRKIQAYNAQGRGFGDIYDVLAIRVLVDKVEDCYHVLGTVHSLWHPLLQEFDDYIASPKDNGYKSLHTTVMCFGTIPIEIQIRTHEMHHTAEYGIAAHWHYKEGGVSDARFEQRISWLRQLLEWHKDLGSTADFLESVRTDILNDQVFVYTPQGEIRDLPAGSTPVDFAYRVHTDLGHRCVGARINGKLMTLTYQLRNGDTVEIISGKSGKGPSRDWLNSNLGYLKTSHAKESVRKWFKKQEEAENLERGRDMLEKELHRLGMSSISRDDIATLFKYEDVNSFCIAIGYGEISPNRIGITLAARQEQPRIKEFSPESKRESSSVQVLGVGDLLTKLSNCCNPLPGDEIIGYVTRNRGITVHRKDCPNVSKTREVDRLISVEWGEAHQTYPVIIRLEASDRVGLLRDVSTTIAEESVNIIGMGLSEKDNYDGNTVMFITLEARGITQLERVMSKLEGVKGVLSVGRSGG